MLIGVIGKPSSGKTTLLNALCMTDAKMGNYPFTTIKPNRGIANVKAPCPCTTLKDSCNPRTGTCDGTTRFIPIEILDVAGLVPGAAEGKGMGNQFLDDLRQADLLIHVVDTSGTTDEEGNDVKDYDPCNDIEWLNDELKKWIANILYKDWGRLSKKLEADQSKLVEAIHERLSGLGSTPIKIKKAVIDVGLMGVNPNTWTDENRDVLVNEIKKILFPMVIAANKIDRPGAEDNLQNLRSKYPNLEIIATSGLAELTLRTMSKKNIINYTSGESEFKIVDADKAKVPMAIKEKLLDIRGSTGVYQLLSQVVYHELKLCAIFPVEDTTRYTDKDGRILPDCFLMSKGTTAKQFAGKIHSDLADKFIHAVLANQNNKRISATHELNHLDVIKIVSAVK